MGKDGIGIRMRIVDTVTLNDLVIFAKLEQEANDIEPWAEVIKALSLDDEDALWVLKLYNAYDDISSAWRVFEEYPSPKDWGNGINREKVAKYPISRERRNLFGGRVIKHLDSYIEFLGNKNQNDWIFETWSDNPVKFFRGTYEHLLKVWGVGRQTSFEWAEFIAKVMDAPIIPQDALLWESSGPRQSLERLYGNDNPTPEWLEEIAVECKEYLAKHGIALSWWDFETVICDFNVMRKGRYYPGKHIAMLREEIMSLKEPHRSRLRGALESVIPRKWLETPADKSLGRLYVDNRVIY